MTFTKTSQKFGQWADSRANTVYGLGFSSESHLTKVRTAARSLIPTAASSTNRRAERRHIYSVAPVGFLVCRQVCRVQGGRSDSEGEVSGEDGAQQHSLSGNKHHPHLYKHVTLPQLNGDTVSRNKWQIQVLVSSVCCFNISTWGASMCGGTSPPREETLLLLFRQPIVYQIERDLSPW